MLTRWIFVIALLQGDGSIDYVTIPTRDRQACFKLRDEALKGPSPKVIEIGCYWILSRAIRPR